MPAIPKNVEQDFSIELRDIFGTLDTATTGTPTVNLCKDGTWATATNTPTNTKAGYWKITLTAAETNFREVIVEAVKTGFVTFSRTFYPEPDYTPTKATYLTGDAYVRLGAPAGASVSADIVSIKTDTGTTIPGRLPAALVGGRMDSSVGAVASNAITAASIATDAIDADALAANAVTEITTGIPADVWAYGSRTLTSGGAISATISSVVSENLSVEMYGGYDYTSNSGAALEWNLTGAPILTGGTVDIVYEDASETSLGWSVTVTNGGTTSPTITAEVTGTQTAALKAAGKTKFPYRMKATLSNSAQRVLVTGVVTIR